MQSCFLDELLRVLFFNFFATPLCNPITQLVASILAFIPDEFDVGLVPVLFIHKVVQFFFFLALFFLKHLVLLLRLHALVSYTSN